MNDLVELSLFLRDNGYKLVMISDLDIITYDDIQEKFKNNFSKEFDFWEVGINLTSKKVIIFGIGKKGEGLSYLTYPFEKFFLTSQREFKNFATCNDCESFTVISGQSKHLDCM